MATSGRDYHEAIRMLQILHREITGDESVKLDITNDMLRKVGVSRDDIAHLKCIHVAGTKGKGTVCAMVESILRNLGLKTGTFTSPHLIEHRERIRINNEAISREQFATYFNICYQKIVSSPEPADIIAFPMMFVMAMYCFIEESVDVAIVEVGVGGKFDATNVIQGPMISVITKLDYDHTSRLGSTLDKIAWHKAGIIKHKRPVVSMAQQPNAMTVLQAIAQSTQAPFHIASVPRDLQNQLDTAIKERFRRENAVLAAHTCRIWLEEVERLSPDICQIPAANLSAMTACFVSSINKTWLPGRWQILQKQGITFYMDGAHTPTSVNAFVDWARDKQKHISNQKSILIFNVAGKRDTETLIKQLQVLHWDEILFTPNTVDSLDSEPSTRYEIGYVVDRTELTSHRAMEKEKLWNNLLDSGARESVPKKRPLMPETKTFDCVKEAVQHVLTSQAGTLCADDMTARQQPAVFVTGSMGLVGCVLACIETL